MQTAYRTVFPEPRRVALEPQTLPDPGPGQALLRTERTLISTGTELTALSGDFPPDSRWADYIRYPFPVGYSHVGTILKTGEGVETVREGDRVAGMAPHATHAIYPADRLWQIPDGVSAEAATFATVTEIVMGGVRRSRLMFGESVAIVGAGLLGLLAAKICRLAGAWPVILIDPAEARLKLATDLGATHVLPSTSDDAKAEVQRLTRGQGADIVIEVTGNPMAMPGALRLARRMGRVILLGSPRGPVTVDFHDEVHSLGLELIGAHNSTHPPVETPHTPWTISRHVELFLAWQAAGVMDVTRLITHRYGWRQTPEAYAMLLEDRSQALGVILDWTQDPHLTDTDT